MARNRISLAKELRIKELRRQGYIAEEIARIVNVPSLRTVYTAIQRSQHHWKYPGDPLFGRRRNFLDDHQIKEIRDRRARGEQLSSIARNFNVRPNTIGAIARCETYLFDEVGYPFDLTPSRTRHLL